MVKKDSGGPDAGFTPLGLNTKVKLRAAPGASRSVAVRSGKSGWWSARPITGSNPGQSWMEQNAHSQATREVFGEFGITACSYAPVLGDEQAISGWPANTRGLAEGPPA